MYIKIHNHDTQEEIHNTNNTFIKLKKQKQIKNDQRQRKKETVY